MVIYTLTQFMGSIVFNYQAFLKDLNITYLQKNSNTVLCACSKFDPKYTDKNHQHILTDDIRIISNAKLKKKKKTFLKVLNTKTLSIYPSKKPKHKLTLV